MSDITSIAIVILAALIHAFLQLGIGTLLLLYHASLGRHIKKRTRNLVSAYISGIGYITIITLAALCFVISFIFTDDFAASLTSAICIALTVIGILSWFIYYRISTGTELWIPQAVARYINKRAKITESNTEAFSLGLLTFVGELPFSIALLTAAATAILSLPLSGQLFALAIYTIIILLPIFTMRIIIKKGKTVVQIQRWRVQHKRFFRFIIGLGFLVLAAFILSFKVIG